METREPFKAWHISVSINRPPSAVYAFASNPKNFLFWTARFDGTMIKIGRDWGIETKTGKIKVKFTPKNTLGVLDHLIVMPHGEKLYMPMRVFQNNAGSEVIITMYRRPGAADEEFAEGAKAVMKDMKRLKEALA